jgi:hypothetical protein
MNGAPPPRARGLSLASKIRTIPPLRLSLNRRIEERAQGDLSGNTSVSRHRRSFRRDGTTAHSVQNGLVASFSSPAEVLQFL